MPSRKPNAEALLEQNRVMKEWIDQLQKNESVIRSLQSEVERLKKDSGSGKGPTPAEEGKANPNDFSFRDTPNRAEDEISDPGEIVLFPRSQADCQAFLVSQMRLKSIMKQVGALSGESPDDDEDDITRNISAPRAE